MIRGTDYLDARMDFMSTGKDTRYVCMSSMAPIPQSHEVNTRIIENPNIIPTSSSTDFACFKTTPF